MPPARDPNSTPSGGALGIGNIARGVRTVSRRPPPRGPVPKGISGVISTAERASGYTPKPIPVRSTDAQSGYGIHRANRFKQTPAYNRSVAAAKTAASKQKYDAALRRATNGRRLALPLGSTELGIRSGQIAGPSIFESKTMPVYVREHPSKILGVTVASNLNAFDILRNGNVVGSGAFTKNNPYYRQDALQKTLSKKIVAPGLKVLEQTTRPVHGIAGIVSELQQGHGLGGAAHGFTEGLLHNHPYSFGQILRRAGAPGAVAAVGGFAGDVLADPTTYVSFGAGSVAEHVAADAARRAESKALASGLTREQAAAFAQRAATQTARSLPADERGLTVGFAGRRVPGVTRATARIPRPRAPQTARDIAADVNPAIAPQGIPQDIHAAARRMTRTVRARQQRDRFVAHEQAIALRRQIGPENYQHVIDAVEANRIGDLPAELRRPAKFLQDQFKFTLRRQRQAGIRKTHELVSSDPTEHAQGYFPHALSSSLEEGRGFQGGGARRITVDANRGRAYREPLATLRQTQPGLFSEDLPLVYANRLAATAKATAHGQLNRELASLGRVAKEGEQLGPNEHIFHVQGADLTPVDRLPANPTNGRYVVLDERLVEQAHSRLAAQRQIGILRSYDRAQGAFKRVATATPGFHVRNLVGDTQNAYLGQPGHQLAANLRHAGRTLARLSRQEAGMSKELHPALAPTTKAVTIQGKKVTYDQLAKEAEHVGAIRSGYIGRELEELSGHDRPLKAVRAHGARQRTKRWMQNREDVVRLATYIAARKRGLNPEHAAEQVAKYHFDYGDLTNFERNVARRALPFYTFSARNIPLQARSLVGRPGKYANYEKLREEAQQAGGFPPGYEANLSEFDQRQLGIPLGSASWSQSLPLTDINEIPVGLNPAKAGKEWAQRFVSLVTPIIKDPVEYATNYSFFFRRALENKDAPLVPAPHWVQYIPADQRQALGIVSDYVDKRSGKKTWGWPGKLNYLARSIPGMPSIAQNLATTGSRVGQSEAMKLAGAITGVRPGPLDAQAIQTSTLNAAYGHLDQLNRQRAILNQRGINAKNPTPEYRRVSAQIKGVTGDIQNLKVSRGDKVVPGRRSGAGISDPEIQRAAQAAAKVASQGGVSKSVDEEIQRAAEHALAVSGR